MQVHHIEGQLSVILSELRQGVLQKWLHLYLSSWTGVI